MKKKGPLIAIVTVLIVSVGTMLLIRLVHEKKQVRLFAREEGAHQSAPLNESNSTGGAVSHSAKERVAVEVPSEQAEMLGVKFEAAKLKDMDEQVKGLATIVIDESRMVHVHTRVAGWLEKLDVRATGQRVRRGQSLGGVFSQELFSSQYEYLSALRRSPSTPSSTVVAAARMRLMNLGMGEAEIARIEATDEARRLVTLVSPISGIVLNRGVSEGAAVDPSTEIVTLADLSHVWVIVEVAAKDADRISTGTTVALDFSMSGVNPFSADVEFVYPTLTLNSRTVRVRTTVENAGGALRPGMYGTALFKTGSRTALIIGQDALVDTGQSLHVFVNSRGNMYEPRQVRAGMRVDNQVEILEGLSPGERVVTAGVFLIDSESRLRASGGSGHAAHGNASVGTGDPKADVPASPAHEH